jgi:hypothetical protein
VAGRHAIAAGRTGNWRNIERLRNPWPRLRENHRKWITAKADEAIAADRRKVPRALQSAAGEIVEAKIKRLADR